MTWIMLGVLLVGLDGFELLLQFDSDRPIRCDAKSMFEKHLAVLGTPLATAAASLAR